MFLILSFPRFALDRFGGTKDPDFSEALILPIAHQSGFSSTFGGIHLLRLTKKETVST